MTVSEKWKKDFAAWEIRAAALSKRVLESPLVLEPTGAVLTAVMRTKARTDRALGDVWSAVGLPNRRDQERTLRMLAVLERRVIDLEEKLDDAHDELRRARGEGA